MAVEHGSAERRYLLLTRRRRVLTGPAAIVSCACLATTAAGGQDDPVGPDVPAATGAKAAPQPAATPVAAEDELLLFADIPVVTTGSRRAQPITQSSVPMSILTAEDLRLGGFRNPAEALMFVPGMDVLRLDRNRYAIGVHGLEHEFSDRTLFLIDGRNAGDPLFGSVDFLRLPLLMENISRIEVVRGAGGAAWGASAFNGVVNVITQRPSETQGILFSSGINHFGDIFNTARYGGTADGMSYRLSVGYDQWESSDNATDNDSFDSNDFGRRRVVDFAAERPISDSTLLSFGVGYGNLTNGTEDQLGLRSAQNSNRYTVRPYLKLDHEFANGTEASLQYYGNFDRSVRPRLFHAKSAENDLEGQLNFAPRGGHSISIGGNVRVVSIDTDAMDPAGLLLENSFLETSAGAYIIDRWEVTDRLALEGQFRGDFHSATHADWSGRVAAMYGLDDSNNHVVRAGVSKGYRSLGPFWREMDGAVPDIALGAPGMFVPNPDVRNEQTYGIDIGYNAVWGNGISTKLTAYAQRYEDLIGVAIVRDDALPVLVQSRNLDGAEAYGFEAEAALTGEHGQLGAWYAFNQFGADQVQQFIRGFYPATHKVGLSARWFINDTMTANALFRYTSSSINDGGDLGVIGPPGPETYRVDLSMTFKLLDGRGEMTIGVADLLDELDQPARQVGGLDDVETPGRTFFMQMRLNF